MKNAGEAQRPIRRFYEKGRSAAASRNHYTAPFQAISCKFMKVEMIGLVTGLRGQFRGGGKGLYAVNSGRSNTQTFSQVGPSYGSAAITRVPSHVLM
jgi:hypothetical protein